jgi:hypothetical protein
MKLTQLTQSIAIMMIAFLVLACSSDKSGEEKAEELEKAPEFIQLTFDATQLPAFDLKGEIIGGVRWQDANGENYFVVTRTEEEGFNEEYDVYYGSTYAWGYHFANKNTDNFELLAEFHDFVKECDLELYFKIFTESMQVTDLDENGFGEVAVIYEKACTSDVSPADMKLILFENGNKYVIRGTTIAYMPNKAGGELTVDKSFDNAAPILREHSIEIFKKHQQEWSTSI